MHRAAALSFLLKIETNETEEKNSICTEEKEKNSICTEEKENCRLYIARFYSARIGANN